MEEERKSGRGGRREGAGRPRIPKSESRERPRMCMRAFPDEWEIIKRFKKVLVKDREASEAALKALEDEVSRRQEKPKRGSKRGGKGE